MPRKLPNHKHAGKTGDNCSQVSMLIVRCQVVRRKKITTTKVDRQRVQDRALPWNTEQNVWQLERGMCMQLKSAHHDGQEKKQGYS